LIITCLWRSLCVCRVCPSIFNCQRPQILRSNCKFVEAIQIQKTNSKWR
jgi:hypothetical protein